MKLYQNLSWKLLKFTFGNYARIFYKVECLKEQKEPEPPYVLLSNHYYEIDSFFIGCFLNNPVHYLGSDEKSGLFQLFLAKLVGLIYTQKGLIDPKSARLLFKTIKDGESIALFPEGDSSWDGETEDLSYSIIKLVRKFNVPIVTVNITGGYLTKNRWMQNSRYGKVIIRFRTINKEEILNSSDDKIFNIIKDHLYNNDIKNPISQNIIFKGKNLAHGIQFLIWKCPDCYSSDTIYGKKNRIICKKCRSYWELNGNMKINPDKEKFIDLKDWNEWQKDEIKKSINNKNLNELTKSIGIDFFIFKKYSKGINKRKMIYEKYSDGDLILNKDKLVFVPYNNKEKLYFDIDKIKYLVECSNKFLRFYYEGNINKIEFKNKNSCRYIYFLRYQKKF